MSLRLVILLLLIVIGQAADVLSVGPFAQVFEIQPSISNLDMCDYLKNITDVETLEQHQFGILEQCLYYYLAGEAQRKANGYGIMHAIASLPPTIGKKPSPIKIRFNQITLQHFELNEFLKDLSIHGYMEVSWDDPRLSWDQQQWKLSKMTVHSIAHIWVPVLTAQTYDTAIRNGDIMEMRKIQVSNNGTIDTLINFSLKTFCDDTDFKSFPDDIYKCCYQIQPHLNPEIIEFLTNGQPIYTDPKYFRDYGWLMSGTIPTVQRDGAQLPQLGFCINLQRASNSIRIELTLPMTVTAILFLLSPFLGKIHIQIIAKMFILFLQFITLQLFSNRIAPFLGSAAATPKLLRFHEYAVTMNTLSIGVSIFLWMCSKIRRNLPPWGWLIQVSQIINKFFCIFNSADLGIGETSSLEKGGSNISSYQADWTNAFVAIHGVAVTFVSVLFIFGYLILL
uniref:Neurotransmitter-gated ion-channel ligand-binding domain-containing protein n=1 Tax=Ascaris lumbricoides TaxID=6252 RepID=A0A9J2PHR7_ASCLU